MSVDADYGWLLFWLIVLTACVFGYILYERWRE